MEAQTMVDTPEKTVTDDEKKRQRERVERLLLQQPQVSTGRVTIDGKWRASMYRPTSWHGSRTTITMRVT